MKIQQITESQCEEILTRASLGRLGCALNNQPYVLLICFVYEEKYLYVFSTMGKKIEWMRANPNVCVEVEEIADRFDWVTVIVSGKYEELAEPRFSVERAHARELLEQRQSWWLNALAERRIHVRDELVSPLFFRIKIESLSGLRGLSEPETASTEQEAHAS
jgi:hypothetical protein